MKLLTFGEILWDVYSDKKFLGGAPLNFSAHFTKHGEKSYILSALGNDDLGKETFEKIKNYGVCTDYISVLNNKLTGKCLVTLDENFVPKYDLLCDVAYDYITEIPEVDNFDVLYFGTLSLRSEQNRLTLSEIIGSKHFKEIFVDLNIREPFYSAKTVKFAVENATILKISSEELPVVKKMLGISGFDDYKATAKKLSNDYKNLKNIIITLGSEGAYDFDCLECKEYFSAAENVKAISTVGAGDSFGAAFLYRYLHNKDIDFCLKYASKVAGYVVAHRDAVPEYEIDIFENR